MLVYRLSTSSVIRRLSGSGLILDSFSRKSGVSLIYEGCLRDRDGEREKAKREIKRGYQSIQTLDRWRERVRERERECEPSHSDT